jgi:putative membrane protein
MLFSPGFLGTSAPFYIDFVTVYFTIFPLLMAFTIFLAIKKRYKEHFISQAILLTITIVITIIFEIGLRISGGFLEYAKESDVSFNFMLTFLSIHIVIAVLALIGWVYLFISSLTNYRQNKLEVIKNSNHKKLGKLIFFSLTLSSLMGVFIYLFLFLF